MWSKEDRAQATVSGPIAVNSIVGRATQIDTVGGSSKYVSWPTSTRFDLPSSGSTLALVARLAGTVSAEYCRIFHRDIKTIPPAESYGFLITTAGDKNGAPYGYFAGTNVGYTLASGQLSSTIFERLVIQHDGTNATFWRNGTAVETVAISTPASSALTMRIGAHSGPAFGANVDVEMAFVDGRRWTNAEIIAWSKNKYSIFAPIPSRRYFFSAGAAGDVLMAQACL